MEDVGIFYGDLLYFTAIWYILRPFVIFYGHLLFFYGHLVYFWRFGIFFPVLVCCTETNLATLISARSVAELPQMLKKFAF
jgi:hypothetical protein